MKTTKFSDDGKNGISIELSDGRGFDAYDDGSIFPWDDGNGAYNICEATRNLRCYSNSQEVKDALETAQTEIGVPLNYAAILPGSDEVLA